MRKAAGVKRSSQSRLNGRQDRQDRQDRQNTSWVRWCVDGSANQKNEAESDRGPTSGALSSWRMTKLALGAFVAARGCAANFTCTPTKHAPIPCQTHCVYRGGSRLQFFITSHSLRLLVYCLGAPTAPSSSPTHPSLWPRSTHPAMAQISPGVTRTSSMLHRHLVSKQAHPRTVNGLSSR
jgi:hypothetical protein